MQNAVCWLRRGGSACGDRFVVPSGHGGVNPIRRVLQPFDVRVAQHATAGGGEQGEAAHVQVRLSRIALAPFRACARRHTEQCSSLWIKAQLIRPGGLAILFKVAGNTQGACTAHYTTTIGLCAGHHKGHSRRYERL